MNNQDKGFVFKETAKVDLCSKNICPNGHEWVPTIGVAVCGGCKSPVLAVKMENCPVCNEPVERLEMRSDHIAAGHPVVKFCMGEKSPGEVTRTTIIRQHSMQIETAPDGTTPMSIKNVEEPCKD